MNIPEDLKVIRQVTSAPSKTKRNHMNWIKFKKTLPEKYENMLLWNATDGVIAFGSLEDDDIQLPCKKCDETDCCLSKSSTRKFINYTLADACPAEEIDLDDAIDDGWMWMSLPEEPVDE